MNASGSATASTRQTNAGSMQPTRAHERRHQPIGAFWVSGFGDVPADAAKRPSEDNHKRGRLDARHYTGCTDLRPETPVVHDELDRINLDFRLRRDSRCVRAMGSERITQLEGIAMKPSNTFSNAPVRDNSGTSGMSSGWARIETYEQAAHEALAGGQPALERLFRVAQGNGDQSQIVRQFLAGLYAGHARPFALTECRGLNVALLDDLLAVLKMCALAPSNEIHEYLHEDAQAQFEAMMHEVCSQCSHRPRP